MYICRFAVDSHSLVLMHIIGAGPVERLNGEQMDGQQR